MVHGWYTANSMPEHSLFVLGRVCVCVCVCWYLCGFVCVCVCVTCVCVCLNLQITDAVLDLHTVTLLSQASLLTGVLLFHNCTWPLPANEYATLGYAAPSTVYRYELCGDGHTLEVAQHICEGAAQRRSEAGAAEKVWVFSDKATGTTQYGPYVELTGSSETAREGMRLRSTSDGAPFWRDDAVPAAPSPVAS